MKLTHKAIALMCGFEMFARCSMIEGFAYQWQHKGHQYSTTSYFDTEEEAWEDCCVRNGLVEVAG